MGTYVVVKAKEGNFSGNWYNSFDYVDCPVCGWRNKVGNDENISCRHRVGYDGSHFTFKKEADDSHIDAGELATMPAL